MLQFRAETGLLFSRMSKLQPSPEVLRSIDAACLSAGIDRFPGLALGALMVLVSGCLSANIGGEETSEVVLSSSSSSSSSGDSSGASTGAGGILTTTEDPYHTTGDSAGSESGTDTQASSGTTGIPAMCGDGVLQMEEGEGCDKGDANADDGECTSHCQPATCGDGLLHAGVEVCDDKVNDGSYNGCAPGCMELAARCGDGAVQAPQEKCDDASPTSGCLPGSCTLAKSCKQIKDAHGDIATDGLYTIAPQGTKLSVICDMDADGGGYTFLKVAPVDPMSAKAAELECAKYGMRLLVPRSKAHLATAVQIAVSDVLAPIGPGIKSSLKYLKIFGIYPKVYGQSCAGKPFNSGTCPQWTAVGDVFWVADQALAEPYLNQPGTQTCLTCSLNYSWNPNGTLGGFESIIGDNQEGGESELFLCEVPDMLPPK